MSDPEIPHVPPIEICNGCSEAAMLGFVNGTNQERVESTSSVCGMLALAEMQGVPDDTVSMLAQAAKNAREFLKDEKNIVDRVNALDCGAFCARIVSYNPDGGVYLGQSYRKPPFRDLHAESHPDSADPQK